MDSSILDNFNLPGVAYEQIKARNLKLNPSSEQGISHLSGEHTGGLPFRFFTFAEYDFHGSKIAKYEKFTNTDMIEWTVDSRNKLVAKLSELPHELLEFEIIGYKEVPPSVNPNFAIDPYAHPIYGECIGGMLKASYDRFKEGLNAPGLPIAKWGVLDDASVATLASYGLHSVEQFAAKPRSFVMNGNFPKNIQDAFERAVFYVNGKAAKEKDNELIEKLKQLSMESAQKDNIIKEMQERMMTLEGFMLNPEAGKRKAPGRTKKIITDEAA